MMRRIDRHAEKNLRATGFGAWHVLPQCGPWLSRGVLVLTLTMVACQKNPPTTQDKAEPHKTAVISKKDGPSGAKTMNIKPTAAPGDRAPGDRAPGDRAPGDRAPGDRGDTSGAGVDIKSWKAAVRRDYQKLREIPPEQKGEAMKLLLRMAKHGSAAKDAMKALSTDSSIPQRRRDIAAIFYGELHRFHRPTLERMLKEGSPFAAKRAAELLRDLGGARSRAALGGGVAPGRGVSAHAMSQLDQTAAKGLPPRAEAYLHQLLADPSAKKKRLAATVLAVDYPRVSEQHLLAITRAMVADRESQMQAAFALVEANSGSVEKLLALCTLGNNTYLRLAAANALSQKGPRAKKLLRALANRPHEPMRKHLLRLAAP